MSLLEHSYPLLMYTSLDAYFSCRVCGNMPCCTQTRSMHSPKWRCSDISVTLNSVEFSLLYIKQTLIKEANIMICYSTPMGMKTHMPAEFTGGPAV
jgi:hypothetical protein